MPPGVFKVFVASVKVGHENLAPSVPLGGDDDETPPWLGDCKSWVLLWPKNLLRLEASGRAPTTKPRQGMKITTPPTQLVVPVVPADSGRREEEAPLVADDVAAVKEAMDDVMDEDDDPLRFINTSGYDDGGLMAQQYDSGFERDELMPKLPEEERLNADCKKSIFMRSLQETPPDAASTQQQQREGRAMLSPTTLGAVVRDDLLGSLLV